MTYSLVLQDLESEAQASATINSRQVHAPVNRSHALLNALQTCVVVRAFQTGCERAFALASPLRVSCGVFSGADDLSHAITSGNHAPRCLGRRLRHKRKTERNLHGAPKDKHCGVHQTRPEAGAGLNNQIGIHRFSIEAFCGINPLATAR